MACEGREAGTVGSAGGGDAVGLADDGEACVSGRSSGGVRKQ